MDQLTEQAKGVGAGGLATLKRVGDSLSGPLAKLEGMSVDVARLQDGDLLLAAAGPDAVTAPALDRVRRDVIARLDLPPSVAHAFAWVEDFPLFERDPATDESIFAHHPFTAPHPDDGERLMRGETQGIRALHYDLVYNGHELGSGSIRVTDPDIQLYILERLGIPQEEARRRFGFLIRGLEAGAPPHGGFAMGFDRVVMLLAGASSLREVIAFPKTTAARALFEDAPAELTAGELRGLALRVEDA